MHFAAHRSTGRPRQPMPKVRIHTNQDSIVRVRCTYLSLFITNPANTNRIHKYKYMYGSQPRKSLRRSCCQSATISASCQLRLLVHKHLFPSRRSSFSVDVNPFQLQGLHHLNCPVNQQNSKKNNICVGIEQIEYIKQMNGNNESDRIESTRIVNHPRG